MSILDRSTFFIKVHTGFFEELVDRFDIQDPDTNEKIGFAEEQPGTWMTYLRLLVGKQFLPTKIVVTETATGATLFVIHRDMEFFRSKVTVMSPDGELIGYFKSKLFSPWGGFRLYDANGQQAGDVKGDWKGWNFTLLSTSGKELGTVTKKWPGLAKEILTSADNYVVAFSPSIPSNAGLATLLLAASLAIYTSCGRIFTRR